jgi:uncharacterized protein
MDIFAILITVLGLALFEAISSIDNAIINASVLTTMKEKARRWFLLWGMLSAVFLIRGVLPWLIVWAVNPSLGPIGSLMASLSSDPHVIATIEESAPILLMGGGVFLLLLFFHWLFLEEKNYGIFFERFIYKQGVWFYAIASILLSLIVWFSIQKEGLLAFSAVVGSTAFFITHGFKQNAEIAEKELATSHKSDISKILYLEVIDATFSIDGVLGAFAFTLSIPLILLGNGIGAIIVRQMTVSNIENIKKYKYLKNGAMYSILFLGALMVLEGFHFDMPSLMPPIVTFVAIGYFFWKSVRENRTLNLATVESGRIGNTHSKKATKGKKVISKK